MSCRMYQAGRETGRPMASASNEHRQLLVVFGMVAQERFTFGSLDVLGASRFCVEAPDAGALEKHASRSCVEGADGKNDASSPGGN